MSKTKLILLFILITAILPLVGFAQFDFNINSLFTDETVIDPITITNFKLIWSADTYTPFEYQGRKLPTPGSKIWVGALVKTSGGEASNLKYSWFLDNAFQRNNSGYGRDEFSFYVLKRPGSDHIVKLQVFNEERTVFEEKTIKIPVVDPEIVVFSITENSRFSDRATTASTILSDQKFSFITKPYFFSIKKLSDLSFEWRFANQEPIISSTYDANILDLTITGKKDKEISENNLWIDVINKNNSKQRAFQTIKVQIY